MEKAREILSMKNITKVYGNGVLANSHVDFSVNIVRTREKKVNCARPNMI